MMARKCMMSGATVTPHARQTVFIISDLYYLKTVYACPDIKVTNHISTSTVTTLLKTSFLGKQYTPLGKRYLKVKIF